MKYNYSLSQPQAIHNQSEFGFSLEACSLGKRERKTAKVNS